MATSKDPVPHEKTTEPKDDTCGYVIDPETPLHRLFVHRYHQDRDLKVIITAADSQTGTGKTTLAFWLAHQWHSMFAPDSWQAEKHATLDVYDYLEKYRNLPPGSVLVLDEAEALDARRSMASKNVDFSHYWMKMRVRQVFSILTLPSTTALDSRVEELADVWIEVERRGKAVVHDIRVNSYQKSVHTPKIHELYWPDVSSHPEMKALDKLKEEDLDQDIYQDKQEEETADPKEIKRQQKIEIAQRMRDNDNDMILSDIADQVGMSKGWVVENTEASGGE